MCSKLSPLPGFIKVNFNHSKTKRKRDFCEIRASLLKTFCAKSVPADFLTQLSPDSFSLRSFNYS